MIDYIFFLIIMLEAIFALFITFLIHELGHKYQFNKNKIKTKIKFHPIRHFIGKEFFANCSIINKNEDNKFYKLGFEAKKEIIMGGIKVDIIAIGILSILLFIQFSVSHYFLFLNQISFIYINIFISLMISFFAIGLLSNLFKKNSDFGKLKKLFRGEL